MYIAMHPDNLEWFKRNCHTITPRSEGFNLAAPNLAGIPIKTFDHFPRRFVERTYVPPAPERFVEYGPEDEAWMKPLGLWGWFIEKDLGPWLSLVDC